MGDTTNWEFAAVVAAVVMGLGGLLLFTLSAIIGSWRIFRLSASSAQEAREAATAVQGLARQLQSHAAAEAATPGLVELRRQAESLLQQQTRLQEATRRLVESRALGGDDASQRLAELEGAMRRLEDQLGQIAANVARPGPRMT